MTEKNRFDLRLRHYSPTRFGQWLNKWRLGRWLGWAKDCWTVHQFDNAHGLWTVNNMQTSENNELELEFGHPALAISDKVQITYHLQADNFVAMLVVTAEGMKHYMITPNGDEIEVSPGQERSLVTHVGRPQLRLYRAG